MTIHIELNELDTAVFLEMKTLGAFASDEAVAMFCFYKGGDWWLENDMPVEAFQAPMPKSTLRAIVEKTRAHIAKEGNPAVDVSSGSLFDDLQPQRSK